MGLDRMLHYLRCPTCSTSASDMPPNVPRDSACRNTSSSCGVSCRPRRPRRALCTSTQPLCTLRCRLQPEALPTICYIRQHRSPPSRCPSPSHRPSPSCHPNYHPLRCSHHRMLLILRYKLLSKSGQGRCSWPVHNHIPTCSSSLLVGW